jgi:hypothetical protein
MVKLEITSKTVGLVVNAPEIFAREDFRAWLNDSQNQIATWHQRGKPPGEYSDVFVLVDNNYDGDSSNMPEDIWRAVWISPTAPFLDFWVVRSPVISSSD